MDNDALYRTIFQRKSIRKYDDKPLENDKIANIKVLIKNLEPLFESIETKIMIIGPEDVNTRMMRKAPHYLAIFSELTQGHLPNVGYLLQQMDLYLSSHNIGSCWQGIPQVKKNVKKGTDLDFIILMPFGKAKEPVHRDISEFKRNPISKITNIGGSQDLFEPVRLAPSSTNSQPWYFTGDESYVHAYCKKSNPLKAMFVKKFNQIDMGIALYHLKLSANHLGKETNIITDESAAINTPSGYDYTASMKLF